MKKLLFVLLWFLAILFIIGVLLFLLICSGIIPKKQYLPTEGIWYCEELQIQLCFSDKPHNTHEGAPDHDCYAIIMGEKLKCYPAYKKGSSRFVVAYQWMQDTDEFIRSNSIDPYFYKGTVSSLDKTKFVTQEEDTGEIYTFYRIDQ